MADWQLCLGFALPLSLCLLLFRLSSFIQMIYILYILIFTFNWQRNNFHAIRSKGLPHIRTSTSQNKKQPLTLARSPSTSTGNSCSCLCFCSSGCSCTSICYIIQLCCFLCAACLIATPGKLNLKVVKFPLSLTRTRACFESERERDSPSTLCTLCVFPESVNVVCRIESSSRNS